MSVFIYSFFFILLVKFIINFRKQGVDGVVKFSLCYNDEVEGTTLSVVVEVLVMDGVFVEGDMTRNKSWFGLKSALSDRSLFGNLYIIYF